MQGKLIIFDCDGTLVDSEYIACKVFTKHWSSHGVHFTEDEFKENFIGTGHNAPIVIETFARMPAHANEKGHLIFEQALANDLEVVCGMKELMPTLKHEICVASNSTLNYVESVLRKTALYAFFERKIFSAHQVKNPKPAPDVFLHAAEALGFKSNQCVVVEDSVAGIAAAKAANMKVVGFTAGKHFSPALKNRIKRSNPDWLCSTAQELQDLLNSNS